MIRPFRNSYRDLPRCAAIFIALFSMVQTRSSGAENAAPRSDFVDKRFSKWANIPDAEKVKHSSESLGRMRQSLKDVLKMLEDARNTKDILKLNCVNEKLTQIKGLLRISEQADVSLQESLAKSDSKVALQELTKVGIASEKVQDLEAQARQCLGQLAYRSDENMVVEVDEPHLTSDDVTNPPPPPPTVTRPPAASPTQ
jgi:hypothetical protein